MPWLTTRLGSVGAVLLGAAALLLVAALLCWLATSQVRALVDNAVAVAKAERNAHWKGQIAEAERQAAEQVLAQVRQSQAIERQLRDASGDVQSQLTELEKQNAALLADDSCGIDHDRVRLLNR